jgi:hypothetical protein
LVNQLQINKKKKQKLAKSHEKKKSKITTHLSAKETTGSKSHHKNGAIFAAGEAEQKLWHELKQFVRLSKDEVHWIFLHRIACDCE